MTYDKTKWGDLFMAAIGNEARPTDAVDNTLDFSTNTFPQFIANDPVKYSLQNAFMEQMFSNDQRLKETTDSIKSSYLPLAGGTMTGALNFKNSTWNLVGDDCYMGDHDIAGCVCLQGASGATGLALVSNDGKNTGKITMDTALHIDKDLYSTGSFFGTGSNQAICTPTAAPGDNSYSVATTAYVTRNCAPSGYGLGGKSTRLANGTDLNTIVVNGWYDCPNPANGVSGQNWHKILVISSGDEGYNYSTQINFGMTENPNKVWIRTCCAGTWTSWQEMASTASTVANANNLGGVGADRTLQFRGMLPAGANWHTIVTPGMYTVQKDNTATHSPATDCGSYEWGTLQVFGDAYRVMQLYKPNSNNTNSGLMYINNTWGYDSANPDKNWNGWQVIASTDYVAANYLKLSGGTMTDNIYSTYSWRSSSNTNNIGMRCTDTFFAVDDYNKHYVIYYHADSGLLDLAGNSRVTAPTPATGDNSTNIATTAFVQNMQAQFLLAAHPVGSYYWSDDSTSPATLFGGTWTQVKDKFILAAGDTYKAGTTGGEANHTLSTDEMPGHIHNAWTDTQTMSGAWQSCADGLAASGSVGVSADRGSHTDIVNGWGHYGTYSINYSHGHGVGIGSTGGGQAHNNMPPYDVAYCWKRAA